MGVGLGGRGKRRRNIGQNHGGAKDCGGVKILMTVVSGCLKNGYGCLALGLGHRIPTHKVNRRHP